MKMYDSNFVYECSEQLHAQSQMPTETRMRNCHEHLMQVGTITLSPWPLSVVRFSQWEGRSVRRLECRKKKSLGYLPFPLTALALWFGQQCIPEVPIKGSFLRFNWIFIFRGKQRPHLEPVFSEQCKTGNTAEQCQVSLFNRSFCCSPCHNCIGTRGQGSYPGRLFYHSSSSP